MEHSKAVDLSWSRGQRAAAEMGAKHRKRQGGQAMEDGRIVELYWSRDQSAISETQSKYGSYCYTIAHHILARAEDAEESVNDTWLAAWNAMPPHRPNILSTFLGKLTRRISLRKRRDLCRDKRGGGTVDLALEELEECIPYGGGVEEAVEAKELSAAIDRFLEALPAVDRDVFVARYWFLAPLPEISLKFGFSESKTKSMLFRTREKLKKHLHKEGLL